MFPEPRNLLEQERSTGQGLLPGQAPRQASLLDRSACWAVQPASQVSFPDKSALRIPRQVSLLDRSACWTGQPPWTSQLPRQASLLDRSARLDRSRRSISQTSQPRGQVNFPDRSPFQTDQPYEHVNFTDQPPGQGSFPDRSNSKTGQLSGQVSFPDMSSTWTGQLPDKFALGQPPRWGSLQTDLRELPRQVGLQCRSAGQTC